MDVPTTPELSSRQPFRLNKRQSLVFERLYRLVGPSAADFYKDACRHMVVDPPFEATTNIVGHLLREIESALRAVLVSVTGPIPKTSQTDNHIIAIQAILKSLGIPDTDPIAQAWLQFPGDDGLQSYAHRPGLDPVRPFNQDFKNLWANMDDILNVVLDKFESQYIKVFEKVDELVAKTDPTAEDVKALKNNIPHNLISHERFFKNLNNPKWLPLLKESGFFKNPPQPERNQEAGTIRYPVWPASEYLLKMTAAEPEKITEILLEIPDTSNANVKSALLTITEQLPSKQQSALKAKMDEWVTADHELFLLEPAKKLITKMTANGDLDSAFGLTKKLLEILPDPKSENPPTDGYIPLWDPKSRLDYWQYGEFLKKDFPALISADSSRALDLVAGLLVDFLNFRFLKHKDNPNYEDYLHIPRPAIEDHPQNQHHQDDEDALISAIRDIAESIVKNDPKNLPKIVEYLESKRWIIFRRIAIWLLSKYPDTERKMTADHILDSSILEEGHLEHEFALLIKSGFPLLEPAEREKFFAWIAEGEKELQDAKSKGEITEDQANRKKEYWQRDKLSYVAEYLKGEWKEKYDSLVAKYGEAEHPDFSSFMTHWVGPTSDFKVDDLAKMPIDDLIKTLSTWVPKEDKFGYGSSKEGLGRELTVAIKQDPAKFNSVAAKFIGLDPTYVRSLLQALEDLARNKSALSWDPIFVLMEWIVSQPRDIPGRPKDYDGDQDPDWGWARKSVATLLSSGFNNNLISYSDRNRAWKILSYLTTDPDPTPASEVDKDGDPINDPYGLSINTTRGEAMGAVIEYALWVNRREGESGNKDFSFSVVPEVQEVLDYHLDPNNDPSVAIRAVYGYFFPWLLLMDRSWTESNLDKIFPPGKFEDPLYLAAWEAYILYNRLYDDPFNVLEAHHIEAIKNLGKVNKKRQRPTDRDERLAEHIMIQYWRGKIDLSHPVMKTFWEEGDAETRGYAIGFIGRSLQSDNDALEASVADSLKKLWEQRYSIANTATDKTPFEEEISAFGWWFSSGKFDEQWSITEFLKALDVGSKPQSDHFVIDKLTDMCASYPLQSVQILSRLVLREDPSWVIFGDKDKIETILTTALDSTDAQAQQEARDLVNRLVARGHAGCSDLLNGR